MIIEQNYILGLQSASLSTDIPSTKNGILYQIDIKNDQIVGFNLLSQVKKAPSLPKNTFSQPSEGVKNITSTFEYIIEELRSYTDITPSIVSKVITQAFNVIGEQNSKGTPRYATTIRDACTRRIRINTKGELASYMYDYLMGNDTRLKDLLFDKYKKGTDEDIQALTDLFKKFKL